MKIHRFIGDFNLNQNEIAITNPQNIKQIKDVLRLKKGETIILGNGKDESVEVIIDSISSKCITCKVNKKIEKEIIKRKVNLYLAILKKENFELAVQKAVEVGVSNITPVITERTIKTGLNIERLNKIILEASEQCGRSIVPTLSPIFDFKNAIEEGGRSEEKIIFTPSLASDRVHLVDNKYTPNKNSKDISIFIGPEGGFTDKEISLAKDSGYTVASLGPLTLRGETAAIVATYRIVEGI